MTTVVLVDGSNVARCSEWRAQLDAGAGDHELRRRLVDAICSWAGREGHEVVVAFDGAGPWQPGSVQASPDVEVVGSGAREGDDLLERRAAELRRARRTHWVVTSDRALRQVAGAGAELEIDSGAFVAQLMSEPGARGDEAAAEAARAATDYGAPSQLRGLLDEDTRAALERMRRGE